MKKILSLIMVIMMALPIFASCTKKPSEPSNPSTSISSQTPVTSTQTPSTSSKPSTSVSTQTPSTSSKPSTSVSTQTPTTSTSSTQVSTSSGMGGGSQTTVSGFNYEDYREVTSDYNRNLFYYNELKFEVADPTVIYISDTNSSEYGYFYAYGTSDQIGCHGFQAWRSKDLTNWEDMGPVYLPDFTNNWAYTNYWAPEIIYDEVGQTIGGVKYHYFMFYNAEKYDANEDFVSGTNRNTTQHLSVLYAKEPNGPFIHPNNVSNQDGKALSVNAPAFDFSHSNTAIASDMRCTNVIDASPFIDDDGTKYMYYSGWGANKEGSSAQCIYAVRMKDWLTPDYSTTNVILQTHRMTVGGALIDHEGRQSGAWVNEGPFMIKRNGTYMMSFSIYGYTDTNYQVRLATSTNPLNGFTKLEPTQGGSIIRTNPDWDGVLQSVGHHSLIEVGNEVYIAYHTFKDRTSIAAGRALAVDKIQFVNYGGREIMYANGPTYGLQALPEAVSGYRNIAGEAAISGDQTSTSNDISYLTDGLIMYNSELDMGAITKDVRFKKNAKLTIDFGTNYKSVRAFMLHFSRDYSCSITEGGILSATITYKSTSGDKQVVVDDFKFDYSKYVYDIGGVVYPGGSAILEFAEIPVKKIEVQFNSKYVFALSEVMVLGDPNGDLSPVSDEEIRAPYSYVNAEVPAIKKVVNGTTIGTATAGGVEFNNTYGIDVSNDTETTKSIKTIGPRDQYAYLKGVSGDIVYFEAYINVYEDQAYMGDKYPKLGLVAKNSSACTFFYLDAANNYTNEYIGYTQSKIGGGDWDWGSTEITARAPGIVYKGAGNYVKLAMARIDNYFWFFLDDVKVFESAEQRGMKDGEEAVYGFLCFNSGMEVKDYSYLTDRTQVEAKKDELLANTPVLVNGSTFGSIEGGVQSGVQWDLSQDYASDYVHYADRQAVLTKSDGLDNYLYFINENSSRMYLEATFEVTGIISADAYPKFGFLFENDEGNGILFYADCATGIQGTATVDQITGNTYAYVPRRGGGYVWGSEVNSAAGKFVPGQQNKLAIYRQGSIFKFIVNDEVVHTTSTASVGSGVYPAIVSFNVGLKVTKYRITSDTTDEKMQLYYEETTAEDGSVSNLVFGDANTNLVQQGTWTIGPGSGSSTAAGEAMTWATEIGGKNFYLEADISAGTPLNNDEYPKVGLTLRNGAQELFFYIDAQNIGAYGSNNWVCYATRIWNGTVAGEWNWAYRATPVPGMLYTAGDYAKLGIWCNNGAIWFTANGKCVFRFDSFAGFDASTLNANIGVMGFGMQFDFKNAQAKADAASLAELSETLGYTSSNGVTIDGNASDWTGTYAATYEAWSTDATPVGFKASAFMGKTGVYVLYQGVHATHVINQDAWHLNLNAEMKFWNTANATYSVHYSLNTSKNDCNENTWVFASKVTQRSDGKYVSVIEFFVPYSVIGYTGTEEYVAGFFAFRPGSENATGINGGVTADWWYGAQHPHQVANYAAAETLYKITATGLQGALVTAA